MDVKRAVLIGVTAGAAAFVTPTAAVVAAEGLVQINGTKLFVSDEGQGPPVLLLHGGFMDSRMWDADAAVLKQRYRVIRFDLRGFGRSPKSPSDYLPEDDIAALLSHLKIPRAHVVGISMCGGIAIDFALAHSDRVRSLVLAEPGVSGWQWSPDVTSTMDAVMKVNADRGRDAAIEEFLTRPVFASAKSKPKAYAEIRSQLFRNFRLEPLGMKTPEKPAVNRLGEITAPTLVLTAELGGLDARAIGERLRREVRGARLVEVKGSGHMINLEAPEMFRRLLEEFVAAH
jgi:3-oxoadipate enol-lactonase